MLWNDLSAHLQSQPIYWLCFWFEEKFLESAEDLEKLRNGKIKSLHVSDEGIW